jgi:hypothetical protein
MKDRDTIQELLSPLKRLKTTTPMEASSDNAEAAVKVEPVKTNSKPRYIVKVIIRKSNCHFF